MRGGGLDYGGREYCVKIFGFYFKDNGYLLRGGSILLGSYGV